MRVNLNKRERVLLTGLAVVLLLVPGWRFVFLPLSRSYAATAAQLRAGELQLLKDRAKVSSLEAQGGRTGEARSRYDAAAARFAAELQDGGMLVRLGLTAQTDGVKIKYWQPAPVINEKSYLEVPVKAEIDGPYSGIVSFLDGLETCSIEPNLVDIRQMDLSTLSQDNSSGGTTGGTAPATTPATGSMAGEVDAKLVLVFYSVTNPLVHLAVPEIGAWSKGRNDPFAPAGMVSPFQGVMPRSVSSPGSTSGGAAQGQGLPGGLSPGLPQS